MHSHPFAEKTTAGIAGSAHYRQDSGMSISIESHACLVKPPNPRAYLDDVEPFLHWALSCAKAIEDLQSARPQSVRMSGLNFLWVPIYDAAGYSIPTGPCGGDQAGRAGAGADNEDVDVRFER